MDGAHTHGSGGVVELAVVGAAGMAGLGIAAYVAPRLAWVLGTVAVCAVLTVAAVVALTRWMPAVRVWSPEPARLTAREVPAALPPAGAPALEQHVHYHAHYHAADGTLAPPLDPHRLRVEAPPAGSLAEPHDH